MEVVGEARDGEEAVQKALEIKPDIVIMDLSMPKKNGMLALRQINEANSDIKIIVLTMHEEKEYIFRVLQAGASSRSEEHTSELQSRGHLVCRLLLEKKKD